MNRQIIENRRVGLGISKKKLTDLVGINATKYTQFINGEVEIFTSTLEKIIKELKLKIIFYETEN